MDRRKVVGFPDYEVGSDGFVYSAAGRRLSIVLSSKGYARVEMRLNGKRTRPALHKIVLEAFVGPRGKGQVCRHLNGDKLDNRLENLCWGSQLDNYEDGLQHGTVIERKLTDLDVMYIRKSGRGVSALARMLGVGRGTVEDVLSGISYKWVGEDEK